MTTHAGKVKNSKRRALLHPYKEADRHKIKASALKTPDTLHIAANIEEDVSPSENSSTKKHNLRHNAPSKDGKIHFLTRAINEHPFCTPKMCYTNKKAGIPPGFHFYAGSTHVASEATKKSHKFCIRRPFTIKEGAVEGKHKFRSEHYTYNRGVFRTNK